MTHQDGLSKWLVNRDRSESRVDPKGDPVSNTLNDAIAESARNELLRRAKVTEDLLRQALEAGAKSLTLEWDDGEFCRGATRWALPTTRRKRRAALRLAERQ